jgi:hypothetical protein
LLAGTFQQPAVLNLPLLNFFSQLFEFIKQALIKFPIIYALQKIFEELSPHLIPDIDCY